MKNPERVAALLAELKAECEYRYEFDAVTALAQTVSEMPRVTVIDDQHQEFLGRVYHKKAGKYYVSSDFSLHRIVWEYYYGEIPDGYVIHHIDANKDNNDISNLQMLTSVEHRKLHNLQTKSNEYVCEVCGKIFASSNIRGKARFCSKECNAKAYSPPDNSFEVRQCPVCGKNFRALKNGNQRFCSCSCSATNSAQTVKKYPLEKTCPICGKTFLVTAENSLKVCCSVECGHKHGALLRTKYPHKKICPICNKVFHSVNHRSICCSHSCAAKLREQRKKQG